MFFLPYKLFIKKDKLYVSFNLRVTPRDMDITSMALHIPLPKLLKPTTVYVREITSSWKIKSAKKGKLPSRSKNLHLIKCASGQDEIIIDVTAFQKNWRKKTRHNHGAYIRLRNNCIKHLNNNPPYLVVDTI